ncbi:transmembrane protein 53 [Thalassophryne amazonica]|uniref:transmembrane protein 53 n=1 Tax=Thalassophryne amazonica TaxID=390379 RepID=UPI0014721C5B|nr:transmembrane protein 53 [Thalassophryne amazonica]XP_034032531.1 transmembrane protein 53 [Thalassophryne amazonica]
MAAITMLARATLSQGIISHRLRKNVTLYINELASPVSKYPTQTDDSVKPLILMLPWLGSRPQAVAKYCEIYFHIGLDVLVVESELKNFLWPRWGLDSGQSLLELLHSDRFLSCPLLVHAFSVGGYTFSQMLMHVYQDPQKYQAFVKRIKGQIYDSLVVGSLENMAAGLGKTVFPRLETLVKQTSLLYFRIFKAQTVDNFNISINGFWNTPVTAPSLFFFCENDVMSDTRLLEEMICFWQKRGMDVTAKKWEDSTHAGHMKRHPQEYLDTLKTFLHSVHISPLQAKM